MPTVLCWVQSRATGKLLELWSRRVLQKQSPSREGLGHSTTQKAATPQVLAHLDVSFFRGSKFASVDVSDSDGYQTLATIGAEPWRRLVTGENCWMPPLPGMSYVKRTNAYL